MPLDKIKGITHRYYAGDKLKVTLLTSLPGGSIIVLQKDENVNHHGNFNVEINVNFMKEFNCRVSHMKSG